MAVVSFAADVQAYLVRRYGMTPEAAAKFMRIYRNRKRDKHPEWTIKHPKFMKLATWWSKRYSNRRTK